MPTVDSQLEDLWGGRPFVEVPPAAPPAPPVETKAPEETQPVEAETVDEPKSHDPETLVVWTEMLEEIRLLREGQSRSFRILLAIGCMVFAVIVGYLDRIHSQLRAHFPRRSTEDK